MLVRSLHPLIGFVGHRASSSSSSAAASAAAAAVSSPLHQCHLRHRHSFVSLPKLLVPDLRARTIGAISTSSGNSPTMSSDASSHQPASSSSPAVAAPKPKVSFCQSCGGLTKQAVPDGEEKMRAVCTLCGRIHYENPKMVVGCIVEQDGKVLLCKRKIPPSSGFWTLPAGFMEIGESAVEGATRETLEEACAEVEVLSPFAQLDIPLIGQTYIIFRAKLKKPHFSPGPESLECALFGLDDVPFDSLAFSSIIVTLRMYVEDVKAGNFKFHYCTIHKRPGATLSDPTGFDVDYHLLS